MMSDTDLSQANTSHFKFYLMLALFAVFIAEFCLGAGEPQKAFLDAQTIYDGWEANYGDIKSMRFRALETQDSNVKWKHWEKIEDGKRMYARSSLSEKGFADTDSVIVRSFNGKVGKKYTPKLKMGTVYLGLKGAVEETLNPLKASLCGGIVLTRGKSSNLQKDDPKGRLVEELRDKFPEGIPCFTANFLMGQHLGIVRVLPNLESVAGQMCHVVEFGGSKDGFLTKYWVAHEKGMLLLRYVNQYAPDDYGKMEVTEIASVETDLGQVWYPGFVKWERKRDGGIHRREMRVHEFIPHIKVPPETFDIDFPVGTKVHDLIANISYIVGGDPRISMLKLDDNIIAQPGDANETVDKGEEPGLQTQEDINEVNSATASRKVLGNADNSITLTLSVLVGAALAVALVLWFCIRSKNSTSKETKL